MNESPEFRFVGGCIVPVMFEPRTGAPVLILASEPRRTRHGRYFDEWDGFGGKVEAEESVEHGAAREFHEETLGLVTLTDAQANTVEDITSLLVSRKYLARVDLSYLRRLDPVPRFTLYSMFFVTADYSEDVVYRFRALRQELAAVRRCLAALPPPPVFTGTDFPVEGGELVYRNTPVRVKDVLDASIIGTSRFKCYPPCKHGAHRGARCVGNIVTRDRAVLCCKLVLAEAESQTPVMWCVDLVGEAGIAEGATYVSWVRATKDARHELQKLAPEARRHEAALTDRIRGEYLEKRRIKCLTLAQIAEAYPSSASSTMLPPGASLAVSSRVIRALDVMSSNLF